MKKFLAYIKSSRSDIVLFAIFLLLLNLVAYRAFVRFDLTSPRSYSLSKASVQTVRTLEEPLSVKVFFSANLPAPYNSVEQYVRDLLTEYKGKANRNFSYEFFDMTKPDNEKIARTYKLNQLQIREVKNNEVGFKQVWMGMVFTYADAVEILDGISSVDGLEYKITTTISNMVATTSTLAGLNGKVTLTLYKTSAMNDLGITDFDKLDTVIRAAYTVVNAKNQNKIDFTVAEPQEADFVPLAQKYGIQAINWDKGEKHGILGLVLEYADTFRVLPVRLVSARDFFGRTVNYVSGLDGLEETLTESLKSLVSKSVEIGYITGHGEWSINDDENGAGQLTSLIGDRYTFKMLNLITDDITPNLTSVVINGSKRTFRDDELYKIDQYLLRGGNIILFLDPVDEVIPEGEARYYQQPSYNPIDTGLAKILDKYGIVFGKNYVLDENCAQQQSQFGTRPAYFVPILETHNFNQKNAISKNLGQSFFMQVSSIDVEGAKNTSGEKVTVLAHSSPKSWLMENNISTNVTFMNPPADRSTMKAENLAVLVEGTFASAFDAKPVVDSATEAEANGDYAITDHLTKSVQGGKILAVGTSKLTRADLLSNDRNPTAPIVQLFVRNVIDYMNGEEELCTMRTKGLSLDVLKDHSARAANIAKYLNEYGLVVLVLIIGLLVWQHRTARRRRIRLVYNPNDSREVTKETADKDGTK